MVQANKGRWSKMMMERQYNTVVENIDLHGHREQTCGCPGVGGSRKDGVGG